MNRHRGKKHRTLTGSTPVVTERASAETALEKKRQLNKLAMQVVDHLPCKFVDWKKGPAKWLLTARVSSFCSRVAF